MRFFTAEPLLTSEYLATRIVAKEILKANLEFSWINCEEIDLSIVFSERNINITFYPISSDFSACSVWLYNFNYQPLTTQSVTKSWYLGEGYVDDIIPGIIQKIKTGLDLRVYE